MVGVEGICRRSPKGSPWLPSENADFVEVIFDRETPPGWLRPQPAVETRSPL